MHARSSSPWSFIFEQIRLYGRKCPHHSALTLDLQQYDPVGMYFSTSTCKTCNGNTSGYLCAAPPPPPPPAAIAASRKCFALYAYAHPIPPYYTRSHPISPYITLHHPISPYLTLSHSVFPISRYFTLSPPISAMVSNMVSHHLSDGLKHLITFSEGPDDNVMCCSN